MKFFKLLLSVVLLFFVLAPSNVSARSKSENKSHERFNEIQLDAHLDNTKVKGKKGKGMVKISISLNSESKEKVELKYSIYRLINGHQLETLSSETILKENIKLGEEKKITIPIDDLDIGEYQIKLNAISKQNDDETWGAMKILNFSVTDEEINEGWKKRKKKTIQGDHKLDLDNPNVEIVDEETPDATDFSDIEEGTNDDIRLGKSISEDSISATAITTSISGRFKYYDWRGNSDEVSGARVRVYYKDKFYTWRYLGIDYTNSYGEWSLNNIQIPSDSLYSDKLNVYAILYSVTDDSVDVQDDNSDWYTWKSPSIIVYSGFIGTTYVPENDANRRAIWVMDQVHRVYEKLDNYDNAPNKARVIWDLSHVGGSFFDRGSEEIYLGAYAADGDSSIVMHEAAHNFMWDVFGDWFPTSDCPDEHYIEHTSGKTCAWIEGWADFLPLVITNSKYFVFDDGSKVNMEDTGSFDDGDTVEGRVAGALWDLYDSSNDGQDTKSYSFSTIYEPVYTTRISDFEDYWDEWLDLSNPSSAEVCLNQNSINY